MSICLAVSAADWSLTKDVFTVAGVVVSALGVVAASVIGTLGLLTWRKQLRGQNDHELARRLLIEVYKFIELFHKSRHRAIYSHEVSREGDPQFGRSEQEKFTRQELGFNRRIESLKNAYSQISISLFEAQALWGDGIPRVSNSLRTLLDEYEDYVRIKMASIDPAGPEDDRATFSELLERRRSVFRNRLKHPDEFGSELEKRFREFERELKLKLVK